MQFDMTRCMEAFALMLDLAEKEYYSAANHHSQRVALITLCIAKALQLPQTDTNDLYCLALLHDNGITMAGLKNESFELDAVHCIEGEKNATLFPLYSDRHSVILMHHENYDGSGFIGVGGNEIPLLAQIIHMADALDTRFDIQHLSYSMQEEIRMFTYAAKNTLVASDVADATLQAMESERFWADVTSENLNDVLQRIAPKIVYSYSYNELFPITETMMRIVDSKSRFTYLHSHGITEKIDMMTQWYGMDKEKRDQLHIAANLHDLGKLYVPNSILEKPASLTKDEFMIVQKHTYYTKIALERIPNFENITLWAALHHEKLNGKGYPERLSEEELSFESRLMTVVDIYQALTEDRPYRAKGTHKEAMDILHDMVHDGFIDGKIVNDVDTVIGK